MREKRPRMELPEHRKVMAKRGGQKKRRPNRARPCGGLEKPAGGLESEVSIEVWFVTEKNG